MKAYRSSEEKDYYFIKMDPIHNDPRYHSARENEWAAREKDKILSKLREDLMDSYLDCVKKIRL